LLYTFGFGTLFLEHLPESILLDIIEGTQELPNVQLLPHYIKHFDVLFSNVEDVKRTFFGSVNIGSALHSDICFSPLFSKIFSRFGGQVSEFLGKRDFLEITWMVVEFFLSLPRDAGTEIRSEIIKVIEAERIDIWSWINRLFDVVDKGSFYLLIHKPK